MGRISLLYPVKKCSRLVFFCQCLLGNFLFLVIVIWFILVEYFVIDFIFLLLLLFLVMVALNLTYWLSLCIFLNICSFLFWLANVFFSSFRMKNLNTNINHHRFSLYSLLYWLFFLLFFVYFNKIHSDAEI